MKSLRYVVLVAILLIAGNVSAQQLVFSFINPSFGGNSYNGSYLLSTAQAQNNMEGKDESAYSDSYNTDALSDFKDNLNRQILSQLSRKIMTSVFGEDGIEEGHYEVGDYQIDITSQSDGVNININDSSTGNETTVIVPYY